MNKLLYETLIAGGMIAEKAEVIAKSFNGAGDTVSEDKLEKALVQIRDSLSKGGATAIYTQADVDAMAAESGSVIEALAKGQDVIIKGFADQFDKLSNLVVTLADKTQALNKDLNAHGDSVSKALGLPQTRKSVVDPDPKNNNVQNSPHEPQPEKMSKSMVAAGALGELNVQTTMERKLQLQTAVSQLNAGADPAAVAKQYSIRTAA